MKRELRYGVYLSTVPRDVKWNDNDIAIACKKSEKDCAQPRDHCSLGKLINRNADSDPIGGGSSIWAC